MSITYCPLIEHQKKIDPRGKVSPCCYFEDSSSLDDYDSMIKPYIEEMDRGNRMKPCRRCWQDEDQGIPSLRQSAIKEFKEYGNPSGTMLLDLRINNNCNLACIMCDDRASTLWGKLNGTNLTHSLDKRLQDEIIKNSKNLIKLSVQGGEPFYGNDFIDFIDRLPNKENMQLEIFTNTVTAEISVLSRWTSEFQKVSVRSSVDGTGDTFERIRWPASWNKFERKIKLISEIEGIELDFNFSLQNLNIQNIGDFIEWRNRSVPGSKITISIVEWPRHFHFTVLTEEEKGEALESLAQVKGAYGMEKILLKKIHQHLQMSSVNEELLRIRDQQLEHIDDLRKKAGATEKIRTSTRLSTSTSS